MINIAKETIENEAGRFSLEIRDSNVYLTVYEKFDENENQKLVDSVKKKLKEMEIHIIEERSINSAIEKIDTETAIGKVEMPKVSILCVDNDMKASACIMGSSKYAQLTKDDVMQTLTKSGVVFGINEQAVDDLLAHPGKTYTIAEGKPPVNGKDAEIIFKQKIDGEKGRPKEIEGGRVDYKNLDLFSAILENEIIAEKIPVADGQAGSTVKGKVIHFVIGKDKRMKLGKNVVLEGNLFIAKTAGHLLVTNDKIEVLPVLEIKSDVDFSTGNITFPGNVTVKGNVQAGFFVKAEGSVVIQGSIFGGIVEGETIEIKQGIQGVINSYVKAKNNIVAKFVENADLTAGNEIIITDAIFHSKVRAGRKVSVTGAKGLIAGGHVSAGEEIITKNVGTHMAPPTVVEVGINPELKQEYIKIKDEYKESVTKQEGVKKSLVLIKPEETSIIPENRQELYMKLTVVNFSLLSAINKAKERLQEIEVEFDNLTNGRIKCSGTIFPGVKMVVNNIVYPVRDVMQYTTFYVENGEVKFSPYS